MIILYKLNYKWVFGACIALGKIYLLQNEPCLYMNRIKINHVVTDVDKSIKKII